MYRRNHDARIAHAHVTYKDWPGLPMQAMAPPYYSKALERLAAVVLLLCSWQTALVGGQEDEPHAGTEEDRCQESERMFDSEVRVASLKFEEVQTQLVVVCFILVVVLAKMGRQGQKMDILCKSVNRARSLIVTLVY